MVNCKNDEHESKESCCGVDENKEDVISETPEMAEVLEDEEFEVLNSEEVLDEAELLKKEIKELKLGRKVLGDENSKLESELNAIKDRLARMVAEYDNYRKRTTKEKEGIYTDACADVLKEMFPVLDNLERAVSVEGSTEDLKKGIEMTVKQFNDALEKLNVEEISVEGEFDPNVHNAVMHVDDDNLGKNSIAEVFQKGYKRGDKVLRYTVVKVAN